MRTKYRNIFTQVDNNEIDLIIDELKTVNWSQTLVTRQIKL